MNAQSLWLQLSHLDLGVAQVADGLLVAAINLGVGQLERVPVVTGSELVN